MLSHKRLDYFGWQTWCVLGVLYVSGRLQRVIDGSLETKEL